jgi:hypothetical protein
MLPWLGLLIIFSFIILLVSFFIWKWLPIFIVIGDIIYVVFCVFRLAYLSWEVQSILVVLFVFQVPAFIVIGLYYFIFWGFFKEIRRKIVLVVDDVIFNGKR